MTDLVQSPQTLQALLERKRGSIEAVIPSHLTPERLMKTAMVAVSRNPKILQCSQVSVMESIIRAAELGLEVSGTLGEAYLVPFKQTAQLIIGYRGLARLARQSGAVTQIEAEVVREHDHFVYQKGTDPKLEFQPKLTGERGKVVGAYALVRMVGGEFQTDYMTVQDLEAVRQRSRAKDSGPWVTDKPEMYRKTVFRRLSKWIPMSSETQFAKAVETSDQGEFEILDVEAEEVAPVVQQEGETKSERMARAATAAEVSQNVAEIDARLDKELAGEGDDGSSEGSSSSAPPPPAVGEEDGPIAAGVNLDAIEEELLAIKTTKGVRERLTQLGINHDGVAPTRLILHALHELERRARETGAPQSEATNLSSSDPPEPAAVSVPPGEIQTGVTPDVSLDPTPEEQAVIDSGETLEYLLGKLAECQDNEDMARWNDEVLQKNKSTLVDAHKAQIKKAWKQKRETLKG